MSSCRGVASGLSVIRTLRTVRAGVRTEYAPERQYERESLMLTGDLNCVLVPWVVRYRIGDPYKFLFKMLSASSTLQDVCFGNKSEESICICPH